MSAVAVVLMVLLAPLVQVLVVNRSPWGGPDLVALAVVWLAVTRGPVRGCVAGLAAGLAADVTPPADGTVGRTALVLSLTGLLVGRWAAHPGRSREAGPAGWPREAGPAGVRPVVAAASGAALASVLQAVATVALGDAPLRSALGGPPSGFEGAPWWSGAALTLAWTAALGAAAGLLARRRSAGKGRSETAPSQVTPFRAEPRPAAPSRPESRRMGPRRV
ncbi:hypothetical protein HD597_001990 [Nonomuraea thailandensis]|uniref:Rod shape-determining protein MreD n=1 Tax=Nonomuraea thailandensis TaxID=1188745 RepID=A0A9X2K0L2_9ACTN|nr:hypothetical protein [Nonomuraea thailandensis]MCP2354970.1 hypothetical protein [Nonomuraea thailandensis]